MRLNSLPWLVVLICCGPCLCGEGYFGPAHDDFRILCVIMALPGRHTGPDPEIFNETWNMYLSSAGGKIFNSSDRIEQLKVAEDHCNKSKPDNDPICAFRDFAIIGSLVEHDVRRLQEIFNFKPDWYFYAHYIHAWYQHPRMTRLLCGPTLHHSWLFLAKMSNISSFDFVFRMKSVYDKTNAKGLRQEIDRLCRVSSTETICEMKILTNIVDKIDKLLTYVGRDQWDQNSSEILKSAMQLHFYAAKLKVKNWHHSSAARDIISTKDSQVIKWINDITFYLFDSIQKGQIESLGRVIELLPYTVDLPCDNAAEFLSLSKTICTFRNMIDDIIGYLANKNVKTKAKLISASIDYEKFLREKRFEHILKIGESTQYTLLNVANQLRLEMNQNFRQLASYFEQLAEFDWERARADMAYIQSTLDKLKTASSQAASKLAAHMSQIIDAARSASIGDQVETSLYAFSAIVEAFNPLSIIFTGGSATGILDASQRLYQAMANVFKVDHMRDAFGPFMDKIGKYDAKLNENEIYLKQVAIFITNLNGIVSSSSSSSPSLLPSEFEAQKQTFLAFYNRYDPAIRKDDLRGITAYLEILISDACDILDSTSGMASGISKTILSAKRTCPEAKIEVQKLSVTYEEIYDFQFKLMDSLADCTRAIVAYQAAHVINSDWKNAADKKADISELEMLLAFSTICYKISMMTAIDSYCDILEYTEGHLPRECIGAGTSITALLSRKKVTCSAMLHFKQIPTKPSGPEDKAYIRLKDLYAGKTVVFKIPNSQWLIDHNWIPSSQKNDRIYVQRFEIYLPVVSKKKKAIVVKAQSTSGNQLTPPNGTEYVIYPQPTLSYSYEEGTSGSACRQKEYDNPYRDRCRNMPKICPITEGSSKNGDRDNIFPSIYTQWNINVHGYENSNVAVPITNIPLRVAMKLCAIQDSKHGSMKQEDQKALISTSMNKCCKSNQYYDVSSHVCKACPSSSVGKYKSLFCANEIQFVPAPNNKTIFAFDNAITACSNTNTVIASTQDMKASLGRGYKGCACGWLSEGIMKAPKPKARCSKSGGLSTLTCSSSNTWGVYCINNF